MIAQFGQDWLAFSQNAFPSDLDTDEKFETAPFRPVMRNVPPDALIGTQKSISDQKLHHFHSQPLFS